MKRPAVPPPPDSPTTFERRERLLALVRSQPGIRVIDLARQLNVSSGTIRNDLDALQTEHKVTRVRGGAILSNTSTVAPSSAFVERVRVNEKSKQRIARWAAELIRDGDSIFFDASSTVYYIAQYLDDRRHLTIITNGIEIARKLAQNPSHTVILLGGIVRADGIGIQRPLADSVLETLQVKYAIVSCTGFTPETGLTEDDIDQAQLKRQMLPRANAVVALVDSSKFGKRDLAPIARTEQLAHIYTDSDLTSDWVKPLQQTNVSLTICGQETVSTFRPAQQETRNYTIGFANLSEEIPFAHDVRRGLEDAAHAAGNIDLIVADNQLDAKIGLEVAQRLLAQDIDLLIEFQIEAGIGDVIMAHARGKNIPVIAIDIPMVGATFFGADNYRAGQLAGQALGEWVREHWHGQIDRLIILAEARAGALVASRDRGCVDGLENVLGALPAEKIITRDSGNTSEFSQQQMTAVLDRLPKLRRIAVFGQNDDAALGAIAAARARKRESDIIVVGQGADRLARDEIRRARSRWIGSTAYTPEKYGAALIQLAQQIIRGESLPPAVYVEHVFITRENIDAYYPE